MPNQISLLLFNVFFFELNCLTLTPKYKPFIWSFPSIEILLNEEGCRQVIENVNNKWILLLNLKTNVVVKLSFNFTFFCKIKEYDEVELLHCIDIRQFSLVFIWIFLHFKTSGLWINHSNIQMQVQFWIFWVYKVHW